MPDSVANSVAGSSVVAVDLPRAVVKIGSMACDAARNVRPSTAKLTLFVFILILGQGEWG